MVWEGTTLGEKDVVFLGGEAVLFCGFGFDAHLSGLLRQRLTQVRQTTSACAAWRPSPVEELHIFILEGVKIRLPVFWSVEPNGDLLVRSLRRKQQQHNQQPIARSGRAANRKRHHHFGAALARSGRDANRTHHHYFRSGHAALARSGAPLLYAYLR